MPNQASPAEEHCELTILLPCLNEEETITDCIEEAKQYLAESSTVGEVLVADNGSDDTSAERARAAGARVISVPERGYGNALRAGIQAANGTFTIFGDADGSYDFSRLDGFLRQLREGCDLVVGNRFAGGIEPGAMPLLHRYLGNPLLTFLGNVFFRCRLHDFHCGLRGMRTDAIRSLPLHTTGMEFASESIVQAALLKLQIREVPTVLRKDKRTGPPHLRTWRDGWRHLRFLLLFSPRWLFLYPGLFLLLAGTAGTLWLLPGQRYIFDVHTLLYCAAALFVGMQAVSFALITRIFAAKRGFLPPLALEEKWRGRPVLEISIFVGLGTILLGIGLTSYAVFLWKQRAFGNLNPQTMLRLVIPSVSMIVFGTQLLLNTALLAILSIGTHE